MLSSANNESLSFRDGVSSAGLLRTCRAGARPVGRIEAVPRPYLQERARAREGEVYAVGSESGVPPQADVPGRQAVRPRHELARLGIPRRPAPPRGRAPPSPAAAAPRWLWGAAPGGL